MLQIEMSYLKKRENQTKILIVKLLKSTSIIKNTQMI